MALLTHIQTAHEDELAIHNTELLVMGPEQDAVAEGAVQRCQRVGRGLGQRHGVQRHARKAVGDILLVRDMVRVSEHLNVRVQSLQGMLGVL